MDNDAELEPEINMLIRNSNNVDVNIIVTYLISIDSHQPIMNFPLNYLISTLLELLKQLFKKEHYQESEMTLSHHRNQRNNFIVKKF